MDRDIRTTLAKNLVAGMVKKYGREDQTAFAKDSKVSQSYISKLVSKDDKPKKPIPSIYVVAKFAQALGVQPWELLIDEEAVRRAVLDKYLGGQK